MAIPSLFLLLAEGQPSQVSGMTGLEIFLLVVAVVELLLLVLFFGSYRRLREIHFVVTESALEQVNAFVAAFSDAEQLRDPEKVALVLHEIRRFMNSLQNSLQKHYSRYSTEMSLLDLIPRKKTHEPSKPPETKTTEIKKTETKRTVKPDKKKPSPPPPKPKTGKKMQKEEKEGNRETAKEETKEEKPSGEQELDLTPPSET